MKKYLLITFLFSSINIFAQVQFETSLETAFKKASQQNKGVFIEYYNQTCPVCKKVAPLFESKEVSDVYNSLFISYKIDTNKEVSEADKNFLESHKLFFKDVPNLIYFDKNKTFLHYASAKADIAYLNQMAKNAINPFKQAATLKSRILNGDNGVSTLYEYSFLAQLNNNTELVNKIADDIFKKFNKEKLGNKSSYLILKNAVFTSQNGFFEYWINNLEKIKNLDSGNLKGREIEILKNIISLDLTNTTIKWEKQKLDNLNNYMLLSKYSLKPEVLLVDKRLDLFDSKNLEKDIELYFEEISKNKNYLLEDKIYILEILNELKSKKVIKKIALNLSNQTTDPELLKKLYELSK